MSEKAFQYFAENKNKILMFSSLILTVLSFLWIFQKEPHTPEKETDELGTVIPVGYLIVPVELQNAKSLSMMVERQGVIDLFLRGQILARNLKIIKLSKDENTVFGALVPDKLASQLQFIFASKNLNGALRKHLNQTAEFYLPKHQSSLITTYVTDEN
jgi:hypothetical protein